MNLHLSHQIGPMVVDGLAADTEAISNFTIAQPLGDQAENLLLAGGQARGGFGLLNQLFDTRPENPLPFNNRRDGF